VNQPPTQKKASRSVHPFLHSSSVCGTRRHTDRDTDNATCALQHKGGGAGLTSKEPCNYTVPLDPHESGPKRHLDRFSHFAQLTRVPITHRQTHRPRYVHHLSPIITSMSVGRNTCIRWPRPMLVSYGEYADGTDRHTDGRTPNRYITLSARCGQRNK